MSKPSTVRIPAEAQGDKPVRRADIAAGKVVSRKRSASGAVLPHVGAGLNLSSFSRSERACSC